MRTHTRRRNTNHHTLARAGCHACSSSPHLPLRVRSPLLRHYLCSWFALDLVSILVSAFDIIPVVAVAVASEGALEPGGGVSALQSFTPLRLLRALRLLRLLRLSKVARILKRWETAMAVNYSTIDLLKCLLLVLLSAHWSACVWGLPVAPLFLDDPTGTWLHHLSYCLPADDIDDAGYPDVEAMGVDKGSVDVSTFWASSLYSFSRGSMLCVTPGQSYMAALYWGLLMVTGGGEPNLGMHANASNEQAVDMVVRILTQAVNAHVLATFTAVLLTGSPAKIAFQVGRLRSCPCQP